jgi:hypothetical protein
MDVGRLTKEIYEANFNYDDRERSMRKFNDQRCSPIISKRKLNINICC